MIKNKTWLVAPLGVGLLIVSLLPSTVSGQEVPYTPPVMIDTSMACPNPSTVTSADQLVPVLLCIQGKLTILMRRIDKLETRLSALESRNISYPTGGTNGTYGMPAYPKGDVKPKIPNCPTGVTPTIPTDCIPAYPTKDVTKDVIAYPIFGGSGISVGTVQKFLKEEGSFTYPTVTGYFGPVTLEALKQFQKKQGLTASGQIDDQTIAKMKTLAPSIAPSTVNSIQMIVPFAR